MVYKKFFQATICTLVASVSALTTHIYVMKWLQPYINAIVEQGIKQGINFNPDPSTYSWIIIGAAYLTAIAMVAVYVFLYYHAQHLISGKTRFMKILIVIAIIFGIGGDLVRQPIMDFISLSGSMDFFTSFRLVTLNHIDKWLANIFLAICLVYLCPKKTIK